MPQDFASCLAWVSTVIIENVDQLVEGHLWKLHSTIAVDEFYEALLVAGVDVDQGMAKSSNSSFGHLTRKIRIQLFQLLRVDNWTSHDCNGVPGSLSTRKRPLRMTIWWIRLSLSHLAAALPSRNSLAFPQWGLMIFVYDQSLNSTHGGLSYQIVEGMPFSQKHGTNLPPKMVKGRFSLKNFRVTEIHHHHIPPHHITSHQITPHLTRTHHISSHHITSHHSSSPTLTARIPLVICRNHCVRLLASTLAKDWSWSWLTIPQQWSTRPYHTLSPWSSTSIGFEIGWEIIPSGLTDDGKNFSWRMKM